MRITKFTHLRVGVLLLWPHSNKRQRIQIQNWLVNVKTARSVAFFAAFAAKCWKRDINSASERTFPGGFGDFLVGQLPPKLEKCILVYKNSLACCQRYRHSVESRTLPCPFKQFNLSTWSLLSWHPTHTYLWGRLCFIQIFFSPHCHDHAECLKLCQQKRFSQTLLLNYFHHQWIGRQNKNLQIKCIPDRLRKRFLMKKNAPQARLIKHCAPQTGFCD